MLTNSVFAGNEQVQNQLNQGNKNFFIENKGQWPREVVYLARAGGMNAWITNSGIVYDYYQIIKNFNEFESLNIALNKKAAYERENTSINGHVIKMVFVEAAASVQKGSNMQEGYYNYFYGNDKSKWVQNVSLYGDVNINEIYQGINVKYYFDGNTIRYDYIVKPGSDISRLKLKFEGQESIRVNDAGELVIKTNMGDVTNGKLYSYQIENGIKTEVTCRFNQNADGTIGLTATSYDKNKELIIDPLVYSTFIGGNDYESGNSISIDNKGNAYITGWVFSSNFPTTTGAYKRTVDSVYGDAFITKLNSTGSALVYSTFIGGSNQEFGSSIAVDGSGNAYITGQTLSNNYPTTSGAFQTSSSDTHGDAFITKLNSTGSGLVYSTYIGGSNEDYGNSIAIDTSGNAYIAGGTWSTNYPATSGAYQKTLGGSEDIIITKLNATGSALIYSTLIGGSSQEYGNSIAIDGGGNAYITGITFSPNYPKTPGAFQTNSSDSYGDAFITKINSTGSGLVYSTLIGGSYAESGSSIAIDTVGNAYIAGITSSPNFPTTSGAYKNTLSGVNDIFITKLNSTGSALAYSTFIGGSAREAVGSIAIDGSRNAYITGATESSNYPITSGAYQSNYGYGSYAYITKLNSTGSAPVYSTYIGGGGDFGDNGKSIAIDGSGNAYITGQTSSSLYPTTSGAFQTTFGGGSQDVFVTKLNIPPSSLQLITPNGDESWKVGTAQNITWTTGSMLNVKIELTTNNGSNWSIVSASTPAYSGNYSWVIPNSPSAQCKVRISDASDSSLNSVSANIFTIFKPSLTITSPIGGENWEVASSQKILWSSTYVTNVKIEYSTNNGSNWLKIIDSISAAAGSYSWTIPNSPSGLCKIKISDISNSAVSNISNSAFSILFLFYTHIKADSIWIDSDFKGLKSGLVNGSASYISQGTITSYDWYINNKLVSTSITPVIGLNTGTNLVKLILHSSTGLSTSDSMYISVYSAKIKIGGASLSGISQYENSYYVTSMNKGVYRIDSTGTILKSFITGGSIQSSVCISSQTGSMYVGSGDTKLYCFDTSMNNLWDKGFGGVVNNSASVNYKGDLVYAGVNDTIIHSGILKSLDAPNGNPRWTFQADGTILSSPVILELVDSANAVLKTIIYFGTSKGTVYAIKDLGNSCNLFWSVNTIPDSAIISTPAISKEGMIYIGSRNGYLYRFTWDGNYQPGWKKYIGGAIVSSPIIDENNIVYIASDSGYIYGFNKTFVINSDTIKRFYQNTGINGTPGIGPDGTLFVGCDNGKIFALDKNVLSIDMPIKWYLQSSGPVAASMLVTIDGMIYTGSTDGNVYIMRDPDITNNKTTLTSFEWPTFKGDNQRSKVVRLNSNISSVKNGGNLLVDYNLLQNYPNPFNPSTIIKYSIPVESSINIKFYNSLGQCVRDVNEAVRKQGYYELNFNSSGLASGVYFYSIRAVSTDGNKNFSSVKKMIIMK